MAVGYDGEMRKSNIEERIEVIDITILENTSRRRKPEINPQK